MSWTSTAGVASLSLLQRGSCGCSRVWSASTTCDSSSATDGITLSLTHRHWSCTRCQVAATLACAKNVHKVPGSPTGQCALCVGSTLHPCRKQYPCTPAGMQLQLYAICSNTVLTRTTEPIHHQNRYGHELVQKGQLPVRGCLKPKFEAISQCVLQS
jgi:hypothetical protein